MEILSVQNQYPERFSIISNTTKTKGKFNFYFYPDPIEILRESLKKILIRQTKFPN